MRKDLSGDCSLSPPDMWYPGSGIKRPQFKEIPRIVLMTSFAARMPKRRSYG